MKKHTPSNCQGNFRKAWGEGFLKSGNKGKTKKVVVVLGVLVCSILTSRSLSIKTQAAGLSYQSSCNDGIPENIKSYCEIIGHEFHVCPELLEAMAYKESRYDVNAENGKCRGLLQVNIEVHADRIAKYGYTEEDMYKPYPNITVAADYIAELYETYEDGVIALSIYSGNWRSVDKYKEYGYIPDYVDDVLTRSEQLERLHEKK